MPKANPFADLISRARLPGSQQRAIPTPGASGGAPDPTQSAGNYQAQTYTFITTAGGQEQQLYTANVEWSRVTLVLETAGPVAVAFTQGFTPVLSGKGTLLTTNLPYVADVPRGSRLWIAANTVERVKVLVHPLPWLEQILGGILKVALGVARLAGGGR